MAKKKIIISVVAICCAILIGVGTFLGVKTYLDNKITYTVADTLQDGQGKKAKIVLLAGQSNASGCSHDEYLQKNVSAEKYAEYESGYDNVYINYFASGTNQSNGFVKCSVRQGEFGTCFGPELGLAERLHYRFTDELFFIIKYAWGGTNLFEQWLSPSSEGDTGELYRHFVAYVNASVDYLVSKHYDVEIVGTCWMQGESDSFSVENGNNYKTHLSNFIKDTRKEFSSRAAADGIAFVDATIADNPMFWVYCDLVNEGKVAVAEESHLNVLIDTNAEGLICTEEPQPTPDIPHYDSLSEIKLGWLFADNLAQFI